MSRRSRLLSLVAFAFVAVTVAALVIALVVAVRSSAGGMPGMGGRIAWLEIEGTISDDRQILEDIRRFRKDSSVKGYLVVINSPGGEVGPSQSIYMALKRLRREDRKPVVASIGGMGASGGYYVALGADSIFALPGSLTGSIGVVMEMPDASGLMKKVGLEMNVVKSAEHKDIGSPFRPMTPSDRALLDTLISDVYGQFVEVVQQERHLPVAQVRALADGRVLSGRQALRGGLIDRIGNLDAALATAGRMAGLGAEPRVVKPPRERFSLLDMVLGRGTDEGLSGLVKPLQRVATPRLEFSVPW